jgi:Flp pilus assembly protein CpaB
LRAILERLRDPLWLPVLSALFALVAFEAASLATGRTVLVAARNLPAGTVLTASLAERVRWTGSLPGPVLGRPAGRLAAPVAKGLPLLRSALASGAVPAQVQYAVVGIPATTLLSAPALDSGERVAVYIAQSGLPVQRLVGAARVASGTSGTISLEVTPGRLPDLLAGIAAGHLLIVALPQD